jgi:very-short-patch-repair endonuclease
VLHAAGVSDEMIHTQLAAGRLLRLRHGVYVGASAWPSAPSEQHVLLARAEQVANPGGVISHQSAAVEWGLPAPGFTPWHEQPVCLTFPTARGHGSQHKIARHRLASLPETQIVRDPAGYPVTSLARTASDLVAGFALPEALVVLDAAARSLLETFVSNARRRDYLNPRLVDAVRDTIATVNPSLPALTLVHPARESAAESLSAGHFHLAGLPTPLFQVPIETPFGTFFPDFFWREHRLIGECDGAVKGEDPGAYVKEKRREQVFLDLDFGVVRWLGGEIMTKPARVVGRVARALGL